MKKAAEENPGTSNMEMKKLERSKQGRSSFAKESVVLRRKKVSARRQQLSVSVSIEDETHGLMNPLHEEIIRSESNVSNELHRAAASGCFEACRKHLDDGMNVNSVDSTDGLSALHVLALKSRKGDATTLNIAKLFIDRGAHLDVVDSKGNTSLHIAAREGLRDLCDMILYEAEKNQKSIVNSLNKKLMTALHVAAQQGQCEVVEVLLRRGAKPNMKDCSSSFPLHYAVDRGCVTCCRALAPFYEGDAVLSSKQDPPLMIAARKGYYNAIREIPLDKLDINYKDKEGNTALHIAAKNGFEKFLEFLLDSHAAPDPQNYRGWTPLMVAVAKEKEKCVNVLVERGASLTIRCINESNLLHIAAASKSKHCMETLLKNDEVLKLINEKNKEGYTPLALAVQKKNNSACIQFLEEAGADPFIGDTVKASIIYNSPRYRGSIILQEKLRHEKDINFMNDLKMTPLHIAVREGNSEACRSLLRKGSRIDAADKVGRTPLHWAAYYGYEDVVNLLLNKKASKRAKDDKKYTVLHCAAFMGQLQCCKLLIEKDCGLIKETDKKGKYAIDIAYDQGRYDVFIFLLEKFSKKKPSIPDDLIERFHSYGHKMLSGKRKAVLEVIVSSNWWDAALGLCPTKMHGIAPCLLFRDIIEVFPDLAYKAMTICHSRRDFRLLEENFCVRDSLITPADSCHNEAANDAPKDATSCHGEETPANRFTCDGLNWKRQHPVSMMVSRELLPLLQHPLTKVWITYKWKAYARYIFGGLLALKAFTIISLVLLLCSMRKHILEMGDEDTVLWEPPFETTYFWMLLVVFFLLVLEESNRWLRTEDERAVGLLAIVILSMPIGITLILLMVARNEAYFFAIVALVLAGLQLIHRIDQLPGFSILSSITKSFILKYVKGLMCAFSIISLFAFVFYLLFLDQKEFTSMSYSILSIALWQMGDFNQEIFFRDIKYPIFSQISFMFYLCTFGAFIFTLVSAPSTTRQTAVLNKEVNMVNLIFEIDICFPFIKKLHRNELLRIRGKSKKYFTEKEHDEYRKTWEGVTSETPGDDMVFMLNCTGTLGRKHNISDEKSWGGSSDPVLAELQRLTLEIKNLTVQMNLLQQEASHHHAMHSKE